jgi:hypothetical protein
MFRLYRCQCPDSLTGRSGESALPGIPARKRAASFNALNLPDATDAVSTVSAFFTSVPAVAP